MHRIAAIALALVLSPLPGHAAAAQWLKQPTAGLPRTADGKPNLAAPAPKTADGRTDLSGLWQLGLEIGYAANITADLAPADIQPWARALSKKRLEDFGKDDPEITGCLPGGPRHITRGGLSKIIQTPAIIAILFEDLSYRQIFLDGRQLPAIRIQIGWATPSAIGKATRSSSRAPASTTGHGSILPAIRTARPCA